MHALSSIVFVAIASLLCGCSNRNTLAHRIAAADVVVATNASEGIGFHLTGDEAQRIVRAVSTSERFRHFGREVEATPVLEIKFYRGTNLLDSVISHSNLIWIGGKEYLDKSGAVEGLEKRYFSMLFGTPEPKSPQNRGSDKWQR